MGTCSSRHTHSQCTCQSPAAGCKIVVDMDGAQRRRAGIVAAPALQQVQQHGGIDAAAEAHVPVAGVEQRRQLAVENVIIERDVSHGQRNPLQTVAAMPRAA